MVVSTWITESVFMNKKGYLSRCMFLGMTKLAEKPGGKLLLTIELTVRQFFSREVLYTESRTVDESKPITLDFVLASLTSHRTTLATTCLQGFQAASWSK